MESGGAGSEIKDQSGKATYRCAVDHRRVSQRWKGRALFVGRWEWAQPGNGLENLHDKGFIILILIFH